MKLCRLLSALLCLLVMAVVVMMCAIVFLVADRMEPPRLELSPWAPSVPTCQECDTKREALIRL